MISHHFREGDRPAIQQRLWIWDETLRDGEQTPGVALTVDQKVVIARLLDEAGISVIDVGFPAVSATEREAARRIAGLGLRARIGATARAHPDDIQAVLDSGLDEIYMFLPTSDIHLHHKFKLDRTGARERACRMVSAAVSKGLRVIFIAEDTSRSDIQWVTSLFQDLYHLGIDGAIITDTVGIMTPRAMQGMVTEIRAAVPKDLVLGVHCHNDFGLATANTLVAVEAGAAYVTATVNGIGERAGNASLEETVLALERLYGVQTGVQMERLMELSELVQRASGIPVSPNKPIVGYNAFRHESGIHVQAMLEATATYEVIPPKLVCREREYVLGKHSGRAHIEWMLQNAGFDLTPAEMEVLRTQVQALAEGRRRPDVVRWVTRYCERYLGITERQLIELAQHLYARRGIAQDANVGREDSAGTCK